jgi:malate synthase
MNVAPAGFSIERDLPAGFAAFYLPLHRRFTPVQQSLARERKERLARARAGDLPNYPPPSAATETAWRIELPEWCADQRNQMTGPADDAELCVKMLNSGAPGVMLDLEDSMANTWEHLMLGHRNIAAALYGELTYDDAKRGSRVAISPSSTVVWNRVRGLHLSQAGVITQTLTSASLFDLAMLVYRLEYGRLRHPLCIYIPKSESSAEALWWKEVFDALLEAKGWPRESLRAMALVESHPLAYEMEEFLYNLREYIVGLNLGRWDYMASLIHYNFEDPRWLLPDRNTIPFDIGFFQAVRTLLPEITHKHGALAIGGMTALYPSREDPELNARALALLERDKANEAACLMDGAWTGHPDQNAIAVAQFPAPNQLGKRPSLATLHPEMRPSPAGVGATTLDGTRAAVRTVIRYRNGVLEGRGASLLDGYMEDLATDRIYRLMIAQRLRHPGAYTPASLEATFDEELQRILDELPAGTGDAARARFHRARDISASMIRSGTFDPT